MNSRFRSAHPVERRKNPGFEACGSWPECNCRSECEVLRIVRRRTRRTWSWKSLLMPLGVVALNLSAVAAVAAVATLYLGGM